MTTGFSVLGYAGLSLPEYGSLSGLDGFDGDLCSSESIEAPTDETPTATMNPELPMKLPDWVHGAGFGALVVSPRLRAFLAQHVAEIEFFPLRITSEQGELISDEHQLADL
ncbi:MAG: hypothetical protein H0T42_24665, partial [Deltaproteobacteria bacterium]|nr:hypothetical protein [Deltaproteobacteria bacterium]